MTYLYPLQLMKRTNRRRFELPFPLFSYLLYVLSLRHPQCCPVGPFCCKMFACCCCLDDIQWIRGSTAASTSSLPSATVSNRQGGQAAFSNQCFGSRSGSRSALKKVAWMWIRIPMERCGSGSGLFLRAQKEKKEKKKSTSSTLKFTFIQYLLNSILNPIFKIFKSKITKVVLIKLL